MVQLGCRLCVLWGQKLHWNCTKVVQERKKVGLYMKGSKDYGPCRCYLFNIYTQLWILVDLSILSCKHITSDCQFRNWHRVMGALLCMCNSMYVSMFLCNKQLNFPPHYSFCHHELHYKAPLSLFTSLLHHCLSWLCLAMASFKVPISQSPSYNKVVQDPFLKTLSTKSHWCGQKPLKTMFFVVMRFCATQVACDIILVWTKPRHTCAINFNLL